MNWVRLSLSASIRKTKIDEYWEARGKQMPVEKKSVQYSFLVDII